MNQDTPPPAVPIAPVSGNALDPSVVSQVPGVPGSGMPGIQIHDLSVWTLFLQADWIVKVVIILLLIASIWSWAIIFDKSIRLRSLRSKARKFEEAFWSGGSLEELFDRIANRPSDPMSSIFVAAMREWRRSAAKGLLSSESLKESLQDRIERVMNITLGREMDQLERYMGFLASVGSAAPFVGLFGTVWGIMNSFASIAGSKNTSLAVVAPGIAEALFATALGLVAAIPAVLAYNKISGDIGRYGNRLEAFSGEFGAILSRQLEEKH
jgi:biopolymer transport protein TolQ